MNQQRVDWPGAALVARLPGLRRQRGQRGPSQGKDTLLRIGRLAALKQFLQARIREVARVLRTPPPDFRIDHLGRATLNAQPVELDLSQVVDVAFGFTVFESLSLRTLALDSLLSVGDDFYLQSNARLRSVRAPGLARVAGSVKAYDNDLCEFPPESQIACEGYAVSLRTVCP